MLCLSMYIGCTHARTPLQVRGKLYELLANCVPPELLMRTLALELLKRVDEELKVRDWGK
jgi:hypothetical protein